jgi:endonuclease YncB( thermonuclease family)
MAPARGQKWHSEAVAALDALVKGKRGRARFFESVVPSKDIDAEHGVTVIGRVFVDGKDISWELVGSGNAWVWEEKSNDLELKKLQEWARKNRKGLWALPESDREPPWEFMVRRMRNQGEESRPK